MKYVHIATGKVATIAEIRKEFPDSSIPEIPDLSSFGYTAIVETARPNKEGFYYTETIINGVQVWEEHAIVVAVPQILTPRQIRMVLTVNGLRQAVEDAVAASTDYNLKDWWEYSLEHRRDNELLNNIATAIGITQSQIDTMFVQGASL